MDSDARISLLRTVRAALPYRTRVMVGIVASLLLVLGSLHLPVYSTFPTFGSRIGDVDDVIQLQDVTAIHDKAPTEDVKNAEAGGGVIPTRHPAPSEPAPAVAEAEPGGASGTDSEESEASEQTQDIMAIAALGPGDDEPRMIGGKGALYMQIRYPEEARREGVQGRLRLAFVVDTDGTTRHIQVEESLHPACDSVAVQALRRVRFRPGSQNGTAVPVRMTLPVRFRLLNPAQPTAPTADAGTE